MSLIKTDLEELMRESERNIDFRPRVYLYILTDGGADLIGDMRFCMTDLAHTCLAHYFSPHTNVVNVSWYKRSVLKQHMLAAKIDKHLKASIADYIEIMLSLKRKLDEAVAILFVSRDASRFMDTHKKGFLETLATCLNTTSDNILIENISAKPATDF